MPYTSRYDLTDKVDLEEEGYWVEVRTCLTGAQMTQCRTNLVSFRILTEPGEKGVVNYAAVIDKVDPSGYAREVAIASLVSWNVDGEDGELLPLACEAHQAGAVLDCGACYGVRRDSYGLLTERDQDEIERKVVPLNAALSRREEASFPADGEGRPAAGKVTAPDGSEVS